MKVDDEASDFPVVCAGGSAREVDAHTRLLRNLPADMGVAIVIVNHLTALPSYGDHPPIAKQLIAGDLAPSDVVAQDSNSRIIVLRPEWRLK